MKRMVCLVLILVLLAQLAPAQAAAAEPRESDYFTSMSVTTSALGSGRVKITVKVTAKRNMLKLGAERITVYDSDGNVAASYLSANSAYSHLLGENTFTYTCSVTFQGTSGESYSISVRAYAKDSSGSAVTYGSGSFTA